MTRRRGEGGAAVLISYAKSLAHTAGINHENRSIEFIQILCNLQKCKVIVYQGKNKVKDVLNLSHCLTPRRRPLSKPFPRLLEITASRLGAGDTPCQIIRLVIRISTGSSLSVNHIREITAMLTRFIGAEVEWGRVGYVRLDVQCIDEGTGYFHDLGHAHCGCRV